MGPGTAAVLAALTRRCALFAAGTRPLPATPQAPPARSTRRRPPRDMGLQVLPVRRAPLARAASLPATCHTSPVTRHPLFPAGYSAADYGYSNWYYGHQCG